ncbi:hypothetical protein BDP27DRAFT_1425682 [Rhodocollybia butyracea]|uniref:Uncharacterized protein n=1 Tax=Rhodocollybia butyracea TaxID=206335 RepID=A0A9P5U3H1_9AGAR|nr:hypothetical protein BDP27DRAFT_1425682 [Rhodocollybia butyracea]
MSTIHFLYVSHLSHVLHIFALLLHPLSTWTIGILARLFLYPSPRKTATLTTSDNDVIRPLSQIDSSSSAMLHASNPILLPIIKADAREDQEFEPRNDPDHSYSAMLHASNPTLMPISEADKDQKCEPSNDPDYSSSATLHASNPTFFPITEADTEAEEDQQSEPGNDPVDDNVTSPQLSQRQPASNQAFFTGAQGFAIYGGQFTNIAHASETEKDRDSDTGKVSIVSTITLERPRCAEVFNDEKYPRHKLHNWKVVRSRKNWTFNSAVTAKKEGSDESISVFVQTFEGPGAKQLFSKTLEFSRGLVNGHHLNIIGISPSAKSNTRTDSHYIVYERAHSKDTRRLLAAALVKGEKETTTVGLKTVHGIVSALAHLSKVASSLRLAQIDIENFDTFSDELGHIVLCYTPNMVDTDRFERARGFADHDSEIILCSSLIKKIFTEANHTERNLTDIWAWQTQILILIYNDLGSDDEGRHNQSRSSALELSAQAPQNDWESSSRQPRRELIWKSLASDMPLSDISEAYGDFLDSAFDTSLSVHLPHRFGMSSTTASVHKCKGYRREEVTLTPDAFRNTVRGVSGAIAE